MSVMASRVESSGHSVVSEDRISIKKSQDDEDDDSESVFNNKTRSVYLGNHKKKLHPLLLGPGKRDAAKYIPLHTASKNNLSEFTQRIMSAKLLRVKQVQNQLSETQIQLNELINENRILKNLQKRQEGALRKYEGNHAELPQLIRSHNEEIRTLKANNKLIKAQLRESNSKLKERENELEALRENYNKLKKLCSEKNLMEREKLQKKVEELQDVIKQQDEKIQILSRKILLESKNYRHHLNIEMNKHKETQKDLTNALNVISRLENQLLMKDRVSWIPGGFGKIPHKREPKNLMPTISNKSLELQPRLGSGDNILREENSKSKNGLSESPETELEMLNSLLSSDDTSSPTHDVLPEINNLKKASPEQFNKSNLKTSKSTEFKSKNSKNQSYGLKTRTPSAAKSTSRMVQDVESHAKGVTDKLSRSIEKIDDLVQKNDFNTSNSNARINFLYEELKCNVSKIEEERRSKADETGKEADAKDANEAGSGVSSNYGSLRRSVPKRKFGDEKTSEKFPDEAKEESDEMTPVNQQKFISMTKTWNDIKDKVQEERMKAEQKMKELGVMERGEGDEYSSASEKWVEEKIASGEPLASTIFDDGVNKRELKSFKINNLTNDAYILSELQKTDKAFKRLKNEKVKEGSKAKMKTQSGMQESISYRTESHRAPKYLDEFQSEYQKQNLLKALKAIDVGKGGNSSSEETDDSNPGTNKTRDTTTSSFPSTKPDSNLINELFGSNSKRVSTNERIGLEYGVVVDGIKTRND